MNLKKYDLEYKPGSQNFIFFSEGPKGRIKKVIQFKEVSSLKNTYNLGFGDSIDSDDQVDDLIVSDNKDSEKILATIASAVIQFTDDFPDVFILVQGSTPSRSRYYSMGISKHLEEITQKFEVWGFPDGGNWGTFKRNRLYTSLLTKRK